MFGLKDKRAASIVPRTPDVNMPELWVPRALSDVISARGDAVAAELSPLSDREWSEYLEAPVGVRGSGHLSVSAGTRLSQHVTAFVAATENGGIVPARHLTADLSGVVTPADLRREEARLATERANAAEFRGQVAELSAAILQSPERSWDAYVTLRIIDDAEAVRVAERVAAQREQQHVALRQCPVCGSDDAALGSIQPRTWAGVTDWRSPKVRSCEACYEANRIRYFTERAAEQLESGRTRAEMVRATVEGRRG